MTGVFMTPSDPSVQQRAPLRAPRRTAGDFEEEEEGGSPAEGQAAARPPGGSSDSDSYHWRPAGTLSSGKPPAPRVALVPEQRPPHVADPGSATAFAALVGNAAPRRKR
jgi:hypothetical protein